MSKSLYSVNVVLAKEPPSKLNVTRMYHVMAESYDEARQLVGQFLVDCEEPRAVLRVNVWKSTNDIVLGSEGFTSDD